MADIADIAAMNHFGMAVRGWRERMSPQDSGLTLGGARRISGLRREELAGLAGLSVDYVMLLEQGRARNPSVQVVTALARALRLDRPSVTICFAAPTSHRPR